MVDAREAQFPFPDDYVDLIGAPEDWQALAEMIDDTFPKQDATNQQFLSYLKRAACHYQGRRDIEEPNFRKGIKAALGKVSKTYNDAHEAAADLLELLEEPELKNAAPWLDDEWLEKLRGFISYTEQSNFRKSAKAGRGQPAKNSLHALCNTFSYLLNHLYTTNEKVSANGIAELAETFLLAAGYRPNDSRVKGKRGDDGRTSDAGKLLRRAEEALQRAGPHQKHLVSPFFKFGFLGPSSKPPDSNTN